MRQAIVTKYLGPTDYRGSRVKATADAGSITISWDHALDSEKNHDAAAHALANRYNWLDDGGRLVGGGLPTHDGNVYVFEAEPEKVRLNDWRDAVIDALIEGRFDKAVEILQVEGKPTEVGDDHIDWRLDVGRLLTANGKPVASLERAGDVGGRAFTPHQTDNLAHRIVILLNRYGGGGFMKLGGGRG